VRRTNGWSSTTRILTGSAMPRPLGEQAGGRGIGPILNTADGSFCTIRDLRHSNCSIPLARF
jgi:hypothetical protein